MERMRPKTKTAGVGAVRMQVEMRWVQSEASCSGTASVPGEMMSSSGFLLVSELLGSGAVQVGNPGVAAAKTRTARLSSVDG